MNSAQQKLLGLKSQMPQAAIDALASDSTRSLSKTLSTMVNLMHEAETVIAQARNLIDNSASVDSEELDEWRGYAEALMLHFNYVTQKRLDSHDMAGSDHERLKGVVGIHDQLATQAAVAMPERAVVTEKALAKTNVIPLTFSNRESH